MISEFAHVDAYGSQWVNGRASSQTQLISMENQDPIRVLYNARKSMNCQQPARGEPHIKGSAGYYRCTYGIQLSTSPFPPTVPTITSSSKKSQPSIQSSLCHHQIKSAKRHRTMSTSYRTPSMHHVHEVRLEGFHVMIFIDV